MKKQKGIIETKIPILNFRQKMIMLFHEYSHSVYNQYPVQPPMDKNKYFDNFPFNEKAVRDFLYCMKQQGYFTKFDVLNDKLSDMLDCPDSAFGFRIINVTAGKGEHNAGIFAKYNVKKNEIYVTFDTIQCLSGGIYTYVIGNVNGENKIIKTYTHARS